MKLDEGVAFGALGLAVVETFKMYQDNAPSLKELRCADSSDYVFRQQLLDADMLGLIVVLALGGGGALLVKRWYPLLLASAALLLMSGFHRSVLRSASPERFAVKGV